MIVKLFLASGGVLEISHQFYSLDFSPADFFFSFSEEKRLPKDYFSTPETSKAGLFRFCCCGMGRDLGYFVFVYVPEPVIFFYFPHKFCFLAA